jgi:ribosome-binding factor A
MTNPRIAKLADQIGEIVARMLQTRVKDPRLGFVTITEVRLTGDAREATVFYTELADDVSAQSEIDTAAALESAKGLIRSTIGKRLGLKFTPTLTFIRDATAQTAKDMEELLAKARAADAELAATRDETKYAAGPDPYRHDDEELDTDGMDGTDGTDDTDDTDEAPIVCFPVDPPFGGANPSYVGGRE